MDLRAIERLRVVERALQRGPELGLPSGQAGQSALAGGEIAGRRVEQDQLDPGVGQALPQLVGCDLVGELALDRLEPGGGRGLDALGERRLGEHGADVGGKPRHGCPSPVATSSTSGDERRQPLR